MKTTILLRIFTMLLATSIFMGCSKEKLPIDQSNMPISSSSSKIGPVYSNGSITGLLSPAPAFAEIKVFNDDGSFSTGVTAFPNGTFRINNVPDGLYLLYISYIRGSSSSDFYSYLKVENVKVIQGNITDLGKIILP